MLNFRLLLTSIIGIFAVGVTGVQAGEKLSMLTKEYKLDNGLKIVVREDHRAPVAVSQVWYKVGSADERRPSTGLSHILEHMMFQGTPNLPGEAFAKLISQHGGNLNAFTSNDFTAYYEEVDKNKLAMCFEAEADRMRHLSLDEAKFKNELDVVMEERRMRTDDKPRAVTYERFMAHANPSGPYHHGVIGWMGDIKRFTVDQARQWYQTWYAPNNAVLVVVGDVKGDEIFDLAKKYFGDLPRSAILKTQDYEELAPLGERRIKVSVPAKLPYLLMGYDVPSAMTLEAKASWEAFALTVAAAALDGGESARFAKELVRNQQI
ncbi:MAG TPA: pitrilysin family protein, partial [Gammaproteobacteria bacterium]|nr:pitrilysin family protein [Gammaproteobacteria bacterium]